jgi:hypothetical protein
MRAHDAVTERHFPKSHRSIELIPHHARLAFAIVDGGASNEDGPMAQSGTAKFVDRRAYSTAVGAASVNIVVTGVGDFNASLTWLNLGDLYLRHSREIGFSRCRCQRA